jgi:radical SAM protein with 4Fe4S-binding SPASM domain
MTCVIPSVPVDTLRDRMGSRAMAERIPLWAHVEIIATCNFKCQHCYIAPCAEREDVMSPAQARVLFDKLERAGTLALLLTGGEVLTHKNFKEIYLDAKRRGFLMYVNTNAYLLGERWADFFAEWPPEYLSISLYGLSNERYEEVTGIPKSFDKVVRALDLLDARNLDYGLKCPAMSITVDELPAMRAFAAARGRKFKYDPVITPQEKGGVRPLSLQLAPKDVVDLEERMSPGLQEFSTFYGRVSHEPSDKVYRCGAGRVILAINVHGGVTTCLSSRQTVGNLFEQSFEEVWDMLGGKIAKKFPDGHPCASCRFRQMCAGCPATVEQLAGLPEGYVQQYCAITHLRAKRMGLHETGIPRTVTEGIPSHVRVPQGATARALPVLVS